LALTKGDRRKKLASDHWWLVIAAKVSFGGFGMRSIVSVFAVTILAFGLLAGCNSAEWKNARTSPVAPAQTAPPNADGVRRVTVAELKDLLAQNQAVVIDVRNEAAYNTGHIRGAKLIPEAEVVSHIGELPKDKLIVTYCS
jgi:3-mercaptopyruvate sulfurtransferase SseA